MVNHLGGPWFLVLAFAAVDWAAGTSAHKASAEKDDGRMVLDINAEGNIVQHTDGSAPVPADTVADSTTSDKVVSQVVGADGELTPGTPISLVRSAETQVQKPSQTEIREIEKKDRDKSLAGKSDVEEIRGETKSKDIETERPRPLSRSEVRADVGSVRPHKPSVEELHELGLFSDGLHDVRPVQSFWSSLVAFIEHHRIMGPGGGKSNKSLLKNPLVIMGLIVSVIALIACMVFTYISYQNKPEPMATAHRGGSS